MTMKLKVLLPTHVAIRRDVTKVIAEGKGGVFCLLPRHVDYTSSLAAGVLTFETPEGAEEYVAVNEGILVKAGNEVLVSTRDAIHSTDMKTLRKTVEERFRVVQDQERKVRTAVARLEANLIRRFLEMGKYARG